MTGEALTGWALEGEERYPVEFALIPDDLCVVTVRSERWPEIVGRGSDLFEALVEARGPLDALGVLLECNGSRVDVHPSAMLRQAGRGRRAYVLALPRTPVKPEVVDIFEIPVGEFRLGSVVEQGQWFEKWLRSG